jgi:hypothetical protein
MRFSTLKKKKNSDNARWIGRRSALRRSMVNPQFVSVISLPMCILGTR